MLGEQERRTAWSLDGHERANRARVLGWKHRTAPPDGHSVEGEPKQRLSGDHGTFLEDARISDFVEDEGRRSDALALSRVDVDAQGVLPLPRKSRGRDTRSSATFGNLAGVPHRSGRRARDRLLDLACDRFDEAFGDVG